jgi:hypothetical protein
MGTLTTLSGGTISRKAGVEYSEEPSMFTVYPAFLLEGFESSIVLVMSSPRVHWKRIVDWRERRERERERGREREREGEREREREREVVRIGEGGPERGTKEGRGGEQEGAKKGELFTGEK